MAPSGVRGALRRFNVLYARLLDQLLVIGVASIIVPVTLQIFSRFIAALPQLIWTEEASRFLLVWTVMLGAMIAIREGTHFNVDLFPGLKGRARAAADIFAGIFVLIFAIVFLWYGIEFTETAWFRVSELAELPLWTIHIAWPIAGFSWLVFQGERMWNDIDILRGHGEQR